MNVGGIVVRRVSRPNSLDSYFSCYVILLYICVLIFALKIQMCSSSKTAASSAIPNFVKARKDHEAQLKTLRKSWLAEHIAEQNRLELERQAERKRIVIQKAINLREKRIKKQIKQEQHVQRMEEAHLHFKEHLARRAIIDEEKAKVQQLKYEMLLQDLQEESSDWINETNIDQKITPALFETPATTGLSTRHSQNFKWNIYKSDLKRFMAPELQDEMSLNSISDRLNLRAEMRSHKKLIVRDFLEPMVSRGSDRERLNPLIDNITKSLEMLHGFERYDLENNQLMQLHDEKKMARALNDGELPYDFDFPRDLKGRIIPMTTWQSKDSYSDEDDDDDEVLALTLFEQIYITCIVHTLSIALNPIFLWVL